MEYPKNSETFYRELISTDYESGITCFNHYKKGFKEGYRQAILEILQKLKNEM